MRFLPIPKGGLIVIALVATAVAASGIGAAEAQQEAAHGSFEVASVKPANQHAFVDGTKSGDGRAPVSNGSPNFQLEHRRLTVTNFNLFGIIVKAYGLTGCRPLGAGGCLYLSGGPAWLTKDGFDVQAKVPESAPDYSMAQLQNGHAPEVQAMLQALLSERFQLRIHKETKQLPVYALTVTKNGPKFNKSISGKEPKVMFRPTTQPDGQQVIHLMSTNGSMSDLAELYSKFMDRPIIDRTGLKDRYDFQFDYDANTTEPGPFAALTGPGLFRALQDQAGLKLEPTKGPVQILVIDHVERPSGN